MKFLLRLPQGLLFFYLAFGFFSSCSQKTEDPKAAPVVTSLSTQKGQYAPYELVTIKAPKNTLGTQELEGFINGVKVQVMPNDTLACFLLPDLANGSFTLSLTVNNKDYTVPVAVVALTNVQSPDVYFNSIEGEMNRNLTAINAQVDALLQSGATAPELQNLKQDAQQYTTQLSACKTAYQNLSAADKQDFARAMAANKSLNDEFEALTSTLLSKTGALRTVQDYEQSWRASAGVFITASIFTTAHILPISLLAAAAQATPGFYKAGPLVAMTAVMVSFMVHVEATATAAGVLFDKSIKAYEELDIDKTVYDIKSDIEVSITAKYRSLFQDDETSGAGGSILNDVLGKYKQFKESFNNLVKRLPAVLRPRPMVSLLREKFRSVGRSIYNSYVRITNISNPAVTLTPLKQSDGSLKVRANTTATTDQNVTYDLSYTNSDFSTGLTKRISAKVTVATYNYGLQIGDYNTNYDLIKVQATLVNGQAVTLPNFMTQMVRLTLDGVPVKTGTLNLPWSQFSFGTAPTSGAAITNATYPVTLYDATNQRSATVNLNVTLINQAYTRIAGKTLTCDYQRNGRSGLGAITIRFANDGTYTKTYADGTNAGKGSYSFVSTIAPSNELCSTYTITQGKVGCISLPGESSNVFIPNYMYIYEDGTLSANSFYACTDRGESWVIQ